MNVLDPNKKDRHDPYCFRNYTFSQSQFTPSELSQLNKYWPQFGSVKEFWKYEWIRHGTCYLHIIKNEYDSKLTDSQVFKKYFMDTVDRAKTLQLRLSPGKINTKV